LEAFQLSQREGIELATANRAAGFAENIPRAFVLAHSNENLGGG
jgi:hypothetical protein